MLGIAAAVVRVDDDLLCHNACAAPMVEACFALSGDRAAARTPEAHDRLHAAVAAATRGDERPEGYRSVMLPRASGRPIFAHVAALDPRLAAGGASFAALVLSDLGRAREPSAAVLQNAFGLSKSETALTLCLLQGQTLKEVARDRNTSMATVRVQLSSIFAKTNTNRQAELVALVAGLFPFALTGTG